jgi:uncharacterized protein YjbJ (UPF0337 family)
LGTSAAHLKASIDGQSLLPNGLPHVWNICPAAPLVEQEARPYASVKARRYTVGEFTEKAKGLANEAAGNAKQATGKATDNERLRAEGEAQERKGEAQNLKGKVQGALGDKI